MLKGQDSCTNGTIKQIDQIFHWQGFFNCDSHCRFQIYRFPNYSGQAVVIVSDLSSNQGTSITNNVLKLVQLVCDRYSLNPTQTMWVEHHPSECPVKEDTYFQVFLTSSKPKWILLTKTELKNLIGCNRT